MVELLEYGFFRNALVGILLISVSAAIIGTYIVTRRLVSLSGGVTHACFGGLGLGYYLGVSPIAMAAVFAVGASMTVEWLSARRQVREDSAIAAVWALGMAMGVLFVFMTPGNAPELNSFLFGNILTICAADLWAFAIYTVVLIAVFAIFYRTIIICAFDKDFARVTGLPVKTVSYVMTVLVAVCIVLTIRLVGIMMLMSMLALPQMIAERFAHRFIPMMLLSVVISVVTCLAGLLMSAGTDVPCSAIIVIIQVVTYVVCHLVHTLRLGGHKGQ